MRIAILGSRHMLSNYGGIERVLRCYLPHLVERGHSVTVFSGPAPGGQGDGSWKGVRSVVVGGGTGKYSETLLRTWWSTALALRQGYDLIHFVAQGPGIFAPFTRLAGVPTVVTVPGLDWQRAKWGRAAQAAIRGAEYAAVAAADEIIVLSRRVEHYFADTYGRETTIIPNGMERPDAAGGSAPGPEALEAFGLRPGGYLLFAARLVPEKACHELIRAWNEVASDKVLVVAGGSRYDEPYARSLQEIAAPGRVKFVGHVEGQALQALFRHTHLFVLPSHLEGQSVALLEALGHGRAVLVSDIAENTEVVEDNGFTFRVGDVADLGAALSRLVADPDAVSAMQVRAAAAARARPDWRQVALLHEQAYAAAVAGRSRRMGLRIGRPAIPLTGRA